MKEGQLTPQLHNANLEQLREISSDNGAGQSVIDEIDQRLPHIPSSFPEQIVAYKALRDSLAQPDKSYGLEGEDDGRN